MDHPADRAALGEAAFRLVKQKSAAGDMCAKTLEIYRSGICS
jgi:hypothetical protein